MNCNATRSTRSTRVITHDRFYALRKKMLRATRLLHDVLAEAKTAHSNAVLWLDADGNLNLMSDVPYDDPDGSGNEIHSHPERVIMDVKLDADHGEW